MMKAFNHIQSREDTPCSVIAAPERRRSPPDLNISKWCEEAYLSIRTAEKHEIVRDTIGNRNRISIETNKRKHILTRLDDNRFEYDIIIDEKPRFGEIKLPIEFPRGLEFYKQGMNRRKIEPHIKGSYAVYWKQKNNIYKTGKLCHIYRPKIMDGKGLWCWGEINYDGTSLLMSIPEDFLKRCSYPVIVDPIIGTSSIGSQHQIYDGDYYDLYYEMIMPANPYTVVDPVNGNCTAYIYSYHSDSEARGYPCLYSNSGSNPTSRLSSSEDYADLRYPNTSGEWISAGFNVSGNIAAGSTIWLAYMTHYYLYPYFDNGGTIREMNVEDESSVPNTWVNGGWTPDARILSMYFSYTSAQNYTISISNSAGNTDSMTRITQSIRNSLEETAPTDSIRRSKGMRRLLECSHAISDSINLKTGFGRIIATAASITDTVSKSSGRIRTITNELNPSTTFSNMLTKIRTLTETATSTSVFSKIYSSIRKIDETPQVDDLIQRIHYAKRTQKENPVVEDSVIRRMIKRILITGITEIWDYITTRKVRSKVEITIISRITKEYEIRSRIG